MLRIFNIDKSLYMYQIFHPILKYRVIKFEKINVIIIYICLTLRIEKNQI